MIAFGLLMFTTASNAVKATSVGAPALGLEVEEMVGLNAANVTAGVSGRTAGSNAARTAMDLPAPDQVMTSLFVDPAVLWIWYPK